MQVLLLISLFSTLIFNTSLLAFDAARFAKEKKLYAGAKAKVQWERIFSSQRHILRYNLEELSPQEREALKAYLINHAADSKQPIVPEL